MLINQLINVVITFTDTQSITYSKYILVAKDNMYEGRATDKLPSDFLLKYKAI